ncbi:alpha/beta hydrolase [Pseudonocardia sp. Cha107L01]|uniref:alpha/beta hydrolase n=1 Tax=Pseudonocardia sp. Cha107L01 TaxID=3457576 RepID=UPI00403EC356
MTDASKPTIVLVHGAFADASGWSAVYRELAAQGYPVYAPSNLLRGVVGDSQYIRSFVSSIEGPVVLAGHSYGGCVITNASAGVPTVKSLVYVAAFAPDEGETLSDTFTLGGGSTDLAKHLITRSYPGAPDGDVDGYIDPENFHDLFCADVAPDLARFMAAAQRGFALSCLSTPSGVPGWRTIPSWYVVAGNDATIPPEAERAMAARAGAVTTEVPSSHVAMISRPGEVTELIVAAANA